MVRKPATPTEPPTDVTPTDPEHVTPEAATIEFTLVRGGEFEVHKPGCRDMKALVIRKRAEYAPVGLALADQYSIILSLWADQIAEGWTQEQDPEGTEGKPTVKWLTANGYVGGVYFAPCCKKLVEALPKEPGKAATDEDTGPKAKTAADYRREIDLAIITAAGELVKEQVPEELREQVARLISNQLHHMSSPANGWPTEVLPTPDRSDWR